MYKGFTPSAAKNMLWDELSNELKEEAMNQLTHTGFFKIFPAGSEKNNVYQIKPDGTMRGFIENYRNIELKARTKITHPVS